MMEIRIKVALYIFKECKTAKKTKCLQKNVFNQTQFGVNGTRLMCRKREKRRKIHPHHLLSHSVLSPWTRFPSPSDTNIQVGSLLGIRRLHEQEMAEWANYLTGSIIYLKNPSLENTLGSRMLKRDSERGRDAGAAGKASVSPKPS